MTDATRAREIFSDTFGDSGNFMTPEAVSFQIAGPYAVELSTGTGFRHEPIFGVTVLELDGTRTTHGACFDSRSDAVAYIGELT